MKRKNAVVARQTDVNLGGELVFNAEERGS